MDERLRELERRFEADPDDGEAVEQLARAFAQMGRCPPPAVLRRTARWRPLVDFAARWFERPLTEGDGCSEDELSATEARLRRRLPAALREWFRLVDRRLDGVQDSPVRLGELRRGKAGALAVWHESQGVWVIEVPLDAGDDPQVLVDPADYGGGPFMGRLVESLLSMVVSETIIGAWAAEGEQGAGPLGPLAREVRGGMIDDQGPDAIPPEYAELPGPGNPFFHEGAHRARGDATTVLRFSGAGIEWMAADDASYRRLARRLDLGR